MKTLARISAAAAGVALFAIGGTASALTVDGAVFSASVSGSGTSWVVTMTMNFTNATAASEYVGDNLEAWSLQLPGAATLSLASAPGGTGGWSINNTGKADASGCGNGNVNAICVDWGQLNTIQGAGPAIGTTAPNNILTFSVNVNFTTAQNDFATTVNQGNFHLLTVRLMNGEWRKDGDLISQPLGTTTPPPPPSVPEPGTLALLGLGLLGLGVSRRRL